jgi:hypothetical protein
VQRHPRDLLTRELRGNQDQQHGHDRNRCLAHVTILPSTDAVIPAPVDPKRECSGIVDLGTRSIVFPSRYGQWNSVLQGPM